MARGSQVETRIVAILDERRPLAGRLGRRGLLALAAIVAPIVLLAAGLGARRRSSATETARRASKTIRHRAAEPKPEAEQTAQAEPEKPAVKGMPVRGRVVLRVGWIAGRRSRSPPS